MDSKVGGIIKKIYLDNSLTSIKRFKKGLINKTYDIKDKNLVLRIYPKDFWKVKKEQHLYKLIKNKTNVPVPKILKTGKNYLLMSKINGKELDIKNKNLVKKAGETLAKLHSIKFSHYGWIINKEIKPKFKNWLSFINYDIDSKLRKIPKKSLKKQIRDVIKKNKALLNISSKPCLLHKDYHTSHILVDKNQINGIIDIEWAIAGHNELDIAKSCIWMFEKKPKLEKIFLQGYKKHHKLSKDFNKRKKLYNIIILFLHYHSLMNAKTRNGTFTILKN